MDPIFSAKKSSALEQGGVWFLFPSTRFSRDKTLQNTEFATYSSVHTLRFQDYGQRTEHVKTGHVKTERFRGHFRGHPRGTFRGAFRGKSSTG